AEQFRSRFELLKSSAVQGLIILGILLCLFLGLRLAFWVALGIPVAMLGAMMILPITGESINTISLFAFILVLGIVVDDAIIVGESIHEVHREGKTGKEASIEGAQRVARPVFYAVMTTLIAFAPMLFLPGAEGVLMRVIPLVAMTILTLSLVESLFILPSHLGGVTKRRWPGELFFEKLSSTELFKEKFARPAALGYTTKMRRQDKQRLDQRQRQDGHRHQRNHPHQHAFGAGQEQHRRERNQCGHHCIENRSCNPLRPLNGGFLAGFALTMHFVDAFANDDRIIDNNAKNKDEGKQGNGIDRLAGDWQDHHRAKHGHRNTECHPECQSQAKEQAQQDAKDNQALHRAAFQQLEA